MTAAQDPIALLYDAVASYAALVAMHTGATPATRILHVNLPLQRFTVCVDGSVVASATAATDGMGRAAAATWRRFVAWADDQPAAMADKLARSAAPRVRDHDDKPVATSPRKAGAHG